MIDVIATVKVVRTTGVVSAVKAVSVIEVILTGNQTTGIVPRFISNPRLILQKGLQRRMVVHEVAVIQKQGSLRTCSAISG